MKKNKKEIDKALSHHRSGEIKKAKLSYQGLIRKGVRSAVVYSNLATIHVLSNNYQKSIFLFEKALKVDSNYFDALNNLANVYLKLGDFDSAENYFLRAMDIKPKHPMVLNNLANLYLRKGRVSQAVSYYEEAIKVSPNSDLYNNLANAYKKGGDVLKSISFYEKALSITPNKKTVIYNLADSLYLNGQLDEALEKYNLLLKIDGKNTHVYNSIARLYMNYSDYEKAEENYLKAIKITPNNAEAINNLANLYKTTGNIEKAVRYFRKAISIDVSNIHFHLNLADLFKSQGNYTEAIKLYEQCILMFPDRGLPLIEYWSAKACICDWREYDRMPTQLKAYSEKGGLKDQGLHSHDLLALIDDPNLHLLTAKHYSEYSFRHHQGLDHLIEPNHNNKKIKVAFLSADFREHALSYLLVSMFENINREKFEIHAISFGPEKEDDQMLERVKNGFCHFHYVPLSSSKEIALLIESINVDIAVDLGGYTRHARLDVLSHRPAKIQAHYMGFAGTLGCDFIDYMIVDEYVVPKDQNHLYTEKLAYLPQSYWVTDDKEPLTGEPSSRDDCGLPNDVFVYACFNKNSKITPDIFKLWMAILSKVENSVLWLFKSNDLATENLLLQAESLGVDPSRILFADRTSRINHMLRHKHIDVFLDTAPYNAHTTASDALVMDVPVLTLSGLTQASRVAGSILKTLGVDELITSSKDEYLDLAVRFYDKPEFLRKVKEKIINNKPQSPVFNSKVFTSNMERCLVSMLID